MPPDGYSTAISIHKKRLAEIRRKFDKIVKPTTDLSFAEWASSVIESCEGRHLYLNQTFPKLRIVKSDHTGIIIDDLETNKIVKVWAEKDTLKCSESANAERYILYASLHPLLSLG